ncbi:MAG: deoxyribose-phosphate aldolase [Bacillota bacterium]|nr:deoxyribose-phosphate aldolase [Bacillota bacterium]
MDIKEIISKVDHTLLNVDSTWEQIRQICDDAIKYNTASVCIPPSFVRRAKDYVGSRMRICTVIGFPNGYSTTDVKVFEARDAIKNGADEVDMVINIGALKEGLIDYVESEIRLIKEACGGKVLKVIIEACLLTDAEKETMCRIITDAGADYIKTSTGFSSGGATFDDVKLFTRNIGKNVKIKAAGGIGSLEDAEKFVKLGCSRLGTSRIVKILKAGEKKDDGGIQKTSGNGY